MSSGAKVISAFIRETVAGTTPASGDWSLLKRTSWGVKPTQNKSENNEIGGSRMAQGATPGTVDVGGDVGTKFRWGQHDDFLASCFGAEWSGDSLTMGNERITFSLATYASDVGIASVVRGAQVGSWKMQIPNDGDITATVTFAGLDWESKADDTNFIKGEPVDSAGKLRYSFKEVSAVSLNGVAGGNGFCIDSFDIQFDNKLQTQRCIGTGSPYAGANIPTTFTPSGTVTLSWSKAAWEIWSKTLTGETVPFSFTLSNGEGAYTFSFPKVQVSGEWPDGGNTDIIQVQLSITAADEAPTIFQIVLGAAAIAGSFFTAGATLAAWGAAIGAGGMTGILFSLGASMVLGGVAQMLAPKARTPRTQTTDNGKQNTYFSSLDNMVAQGNVLPVLYGEMRVGSRVASQEISTADEGDGGRVVVIGR